MGKPAKLVPHHGWDCSVKLPIIMYVFSLYHIIVGSYLCGENAKGQLNRLSPE